MAGGHNQVSFTPKSLLKPSMWGVRGGEAGSTISCASQECLVWPGWEVYDWAVTHRGRRCPSPAQRCIQPPLHPSAGSCYTHSWPSTRVPSLLPPPAQFIPWHCILHLWSYCTTLQTEAVEGQHMLIIAVPVVIWPWTQGARALFGPVPAAMNPHHLGRTCVHSHLTESSSNFSKLLFGSKSTEGYQRIASYPKYTWQGK